MPGARSRRPSAAVSAGPPRRGAAAGAFTYRGLMGQLAQLRVAVRFDDGMVRDTSWVRRLPVMVALALVALGVIATAARLDAPGDGTVLRFGGAAWRAESVVVDVPGGGSGLR